MKKLSSIVLAFLLFSFITADNAPSKKERKYATDLLKDTQMELAKSIEGLSESQLTYKPSDSAWSVEGCVKHLAATEQTIFGMIQASLQQSANPEKRAEIKVTDEQLVKGYEDRSKKVKTIDPLKPENIQFASTEEALKSLNENREKIISFINSTKEDLRNHVIEYPFGSFDAYQSILIIASHTNRHTQQIEEVKSQAEFPKN